MNFMVTLENVKKENSDALNFIRTIYESAFPEDERRNFCDVEKLLETKPVFHISLVKDGTESVGFISYWIWDHIVYVEHFAIDSSCRGGGYGAKALTLLIEKLGLPVVLEVEKPEDDISCRRIGFYERLGFRLWAGHPYVQPPYDPSKNPLDLFLMTYGHVDMDADFMTIRDLIYKDVYNVGSC